MSGFFRCGVIHAEGVHRDRLHFLGGLGLVVPVGRGADDGVGGLDALDNLAEGGVLAVQMGGLLHHDEKLAAGGVGIIGPGQGENALVVLEVVVEAVGGELAGDLVARATGAGAVGVAALDHEAGDAAVEDEPVVKTGLDQRDEVVDGVGGDLGIELGGHLGAVFHLEGDDGILSHGKHVLSVCLVNHFK